MSLLEQWQRNEPVSLFVSDGESEQEYRLTFKTMSAFDEAKFLRNRGRAGLVLEEIFGKADERTLEQAEDSLAMFEILVKHAAVMAALAKVELRNGEEWQESRLPETWYSAKDFAHNAPASVLTLLFEAVIAAGNPYRLFSYLPTTEDEKKVLRLTVNPSTN